MKETQQDRRRRWGPPPDSDLTSIPLAVGISVAIFATVAALYFIGWLGMIVLVVVLIAALAISYRVVSDSESEN